MKNSQNEFALKATFKQLNEIRLSEAHKLMLTQTHTKASVKKSEKRLIKKMQFMRSGAAAGRRRGFLIQEKIFDKYVSSFKVVMWIPILPLIPQSG